MCIRQFVPFHAKHLKIKLYIYMQTYIEKWHQVYFKYFLYIYCNNIVYIQIVYYTLIAINALYEMWMLLMYWKIIFHHKLNFMWCMMIVLYRDRLSCCSSVFIFHSIEIFIAFMYFSHRKRLSMLWYSCIILSILIFIHPST